MPSTSPAHNDIVVTIHRVNELTDNQQAARQALSVSVYPRQRTGKVAILNGLPCSDAQFAGIPTSRYSLMLVQLFEQAP